MRAAGVPVEVVPGISLGCAVPAMAGIPITRRAMARGAVFVTGHTCDDGEVHWAALARSGLTLVVFMGLGRLSAIVAALREGGLAPSTPAATIQDGTLPTQRVVRATLAELVDAVAGASLRSPALLVIGAVAAKVAQSSRVSQATG